MAVQTTRYTEGKTSAKLPGETVRVSINLAVSSLATCRASLRSLSIRSSCLVTAVRQAARFWGLCLPAAQPENKTRPLGNGHDPQRALPGREKERKRKPPPPFLYSCRTCSRLSAWQRSYVCSHAHVTHNIKYFTFENIRSQRSAVFTTVIDGANGVCLLLRGGRLRFPACVPGSLAVENTPSRQALVFEQNRMRRTWRTTVPCRRNRARAYAFRLCLASLTPAGGNMFCRARRAGGWFPLSGKKTSARHCRLWRFFTVRTQIPNALWRSSRCAAAQRPARSFWGGRLPAPSQ